MGWCVSPYVVHYCLFHLLLLHFPSYTCSSTLPLCNRHDSSALLQFKSTITVNSTPASEYWWLQLCFPFPSKTVSWENGTNCCLWDGVTCDTMSGHVIGLDLSCSNLQGELHPNSTLFHLTHLQKLNLAFNNFSGSLIYSGIGDLASLTHLNLSSSSFDGDIPSTISHLSKLVSLDLSNDYFFTSNFRLRLVQRTWNQLILNATNLEELVLVCVNMSSIKEASLSLLKNLSSSLVSLHMDETGLHGNFPRDVLCSTNIQELSLFDNQELRGKLPKSNWSVPLRLLDLSYTALCKEIPDSLGHLKSLTELGLSGCRIEGLVPLPLWNLTQLTSLDLTDNNLNGEITPLLSNFKHLRFLYLGFNNFSGHIPNVFGKFTQLEFLFLSYNNLEGQLPLSLFDLTQLVSLYLSSNKLVGSIPSNIRLSKLEFLDLSNNSFSGTIPHWCYSLPSLLGLYLNENNFSGSISEFSTYSLKSLDLSNNIIQGSFPTSIFEMENLTVLNLSFNELRGNLTFNKFSNLKKLYLLDLSHNFLSIGTDNSVDYIFPNLENLLLSFCNITNFPPFITRLQNLRELDLSNNKIQGEISKLFNDNNNLTGNISSTLCNASSLQILILSHNNLTGMIPQCLGTFPSLWVLDLQMNNLYGNIPGNFSKGNSFETIMLNGNHLEGTLPKSLAHCKKLEVLDLGDNYIQDVFPSWLETLPELQVLILRANKFHGIITSFSTKHPFPKLRIFDVSNNSFSGPLPTTYFKNFQGMMNVNDSQTGSKYMRSVSYGRSSLYNDSVVVIMKGLSVELKRILTAFTTIDLSNNMFEGEISQVIGELNSLKGLNLSHNAITGTIPISLGDLRNLEWLDLSWNQLRGEIPMALTNLNFLSVLNLSQNQLEGTIPTGKQFNTFQNDSYGGNPMLCGIPLSKSCSNDEERPHSTFHHEEKFGFGWQPVAVGYACGAVFGMLLGCCFFLSGRPLWLARLVGIPNKGPKRGKNRVHANR